MVTESSLKKYQEKLHTKKPLHRLKLNKTYQYSFFSTAVKFQTVSYRIKLL